MIPTVMRKTQSTPSSEAPENVTISQHNSRSVVTLAGVAQRVGAVLIPQLHALPVQGVRIVTLLHRPMLLCAARTQPVSRGAVATRAVHQDLLILPKLAHVTYETAPALAVYTNRTCLPRPDLMPLPPDTPVAANGAAMPPPDAPRPCRMSEMDSVPFRQALLESPYSINALPERLQST